MADRPTARENIRIGRHRSARQEAVGFSPLSRCARADTT